MAYYEEVLRLAILQRLQDIVAHMFDNRHTMRENAKCKAADNLAKHIKAHEDSWAILDQQRAIQFPLPRHGQLKEFFIYSFENS